MLFGILDLLRMVTTDGEGTLNDFIEFGHWIWTEAGSQNPLSRLRFHLYKE